jgi:hypothetical protein
MTNDELTTKPEKLREMVQVTLRADRTAQLSVPFRSLIALRLFLLALWRLKEREILTVAFFFQLLDGNKTQRRGVHAKTFASRCGTVVEHVTEM